MEWIMIKVRVGQETFCKWGCSSLHFISEMQEAAWDLFSWGIFLGCRALVPPRTLNCFYPGQKGKCRSVHWAFETHLGSPVSGATKALWRPTVRLCLHGEGRARDSILDALLKPAGVIDWA